MLMAGADVTMLCSVLLRHGIDHIRVLEREMREWMDDHEYESVEQIKGIMSQKNCPDPTAFERAQYTRALKSYSRAPSSTRCREAVKRGRGKTRDKRDYRDESGTARTAVVCVS